MTLPPWPSPAQQALGPIRDAWLKSREPAGCRCRTRARAGPVARGLRGLQRRTTRSCRGQDRRRSNYSTARRPGQRQSCWASQTRPASGSEYPVPAGVRDRLLCRGLAAAPKCSRQAGTSTIAPVATDRLDAIHASCWLCSSVVALTTCTEHRAQRGVDTQPARWNLALACCCSWSSCWLTTGSEASGSRLPSTTLQRAV